MVYIVPTIRFLLHGANLKFLQKEFQVVLQVLPRDRLSKLS